MDYPPFDFVRSYVFKRSFFNGWADFIGSVRMAFYALLNYAKLYEHIRPSKIKGKPTSMKDTRADGCLDETAGGHSPRRDSRIA